MLCATAERGTPAVKPDAIGKRGKKKMLRMCELIELAAARRFGSTRGDRWRETAQQFALAMPDFAWYRYGTETGKFV